MLTTVLDRHFKTHLTNDNSCFNLLKLQFRLNETTKNVRTTSTLLNSVAKSAFFSVKSVCFESRTAGKIPKTADSGNSGS